DVWLGWGDRSFAGPGLRWRGPFEYYALSSRDVNRLRYKVLVRCSGPFGAPAVSLLRPDRGSRTWSLAVSAPQSEGMAVHPQSPFRALAGRQLPDETRPLSGTSIVFAMKRLGVGESAARSVLQRMTAKGLIDRHKEGRKTFYSLSDRGRRILREGQEKMYSGWQPQGWDGRWTLVRVQV